MKKLKAELSEGFLLLQKTSFTLFFFFIFSFFIHAQEKSSNANQWQSVGGEIVASGTHDFTNLWYLGGNGKWFKNDENRNKPATHSADEVNRDVVIPKGQIVVKGPGFLAKFIRRKKGIAVGTGLKFSETGKDFWSASIGGQDLLKGSDGNWKWYDNNIRDFDPGKSNSGWVPAGRSLALDVNLYNNETGIGYIQYAPVGIEYEYWFFPREGGQVISKGDISKSDENKDSNSGEIVGKVVKGSVFDETIDKWLKPGDDIKMGHVYETGANENANIELFENSTHIKLNKNTKIKVKNKVTKKQSGGVMLFAGRLWSLFKGKKGKSGYAVETYNSVTSVEGTEFETSYNQETEETSVAVFEGTVLFECKTDITPPVYLSAGMSANMDQNCIITPHNSAVTSGTQVSLIADSHVYAYSYSNWNKANWGKYKVLGAGWNPTGGEKRAYLKFDISGIDKSTFEKASLKLYHYLTAGSNSADLGVYTVRSQWNEGNGNYTPANIAAPGEVCWIAQPQTDQYPVAYFNPGTQTNKFVEVDITTLVKSWLNGMPNHGLAIKAGENYLNGPESVYGFYSGEYEDADKRPHILINGAMGSLQPPPGTLATTKPPLVSGEWAITCNDGNIYKYNLKLVQYDSGFYGDMIRTNGSEENSKVEGHISPDGSIEFIRSKGNWKQYYIGEINLQSGSKANYMNGLYGNKGQEKFAWDAKAIKGSSSNISVTGQWKVNQHNGYDGTLTFEQDQSGKITGTANWNQYENGTINGQLSGESIEFTISYASGDIGKYNGTVTQNGIKMVNGFVKAKNGKTASWDASKIFAVSSMSGQWLIDQSNGYNGLMNLTQDQSGGITGNAIWNGSLKGTITGRASGNAVEFTISYPGGDKGLYKGTITQNGTRIINGTAKGNNGVTASWDASR